MIGYKYRIQALAIAASIPDHPEAQNLFARYGWKKLSAELQVKRADSKIKEYTVILDKEIARQTKLAKKEGGKRLSASDFNRQLVIVSKWCGFHISDRIMLSELAGYFREYCEKLKMYDNGGNYKKRGAHPAKRA